MTLVDLRAGEEATLSSIDLPERAASRLMELGFFPGSSITAAGSAPGGDPRVYRIEGTEIALRRETAIHMKVLREIR
jgi:ferrous iron transport protein A